MNHRNKHNQLARNTNQAKALYRGLVQSLFEGGRIQTTLAKAKAVVGDVDHAINLAKTNTVNSKRLLIKMLGGESSFDNLYKRASAMTGRNSGYSRIIRMENRGSDNAQMAILELVDLNTMAPETSPVVTKKGVNEEKLAITEGEIVEKKKKPVRKSAAKSKTPVKSKSKAK